MSDLYSEDLFDTDSATHVPADLLSRFEHIEKMLCKMNKKRKGGKKGKKNKSKKKLKKRLAAMNMQNMQLLYMMQATHPQHTQHPEWWQKALTNTLPRIVDLASNVYKSRKEPKHFRFPPSKEIIGLRLGADGVWR